MDDLFNELSCIWTTAKFRRCSIVTSKRAILSSLVKKVRTDDDETLAS